MFCFELPYPGIKNITVFSKIQLKIARRELGTPLLQNPDKLMYVNSSLFKPCLCVCAGQQSFSILY